MLIIKGHNNHMPTMTSNHGDNVNNQEVSTLEKKAFHMAPLSLSAGIGVVHTICLKYGMIRLFKAIFL